MNILTLVLLATIIIVTMVGIAGEKYMAHPFNNVLSWAVFGAVFVMLLDGSTDTIIQYFIYINFALSFLIVPVMLYIAKKWDVLDDKHDIISLLGIRKENNRLKFSFFQFLIVITNSFFVFCYFLCCMLWEVFVIFVHYIEGVVLKYIHIVLFKGNKFIVTKRKVKLFAVMYDGTNLDIIKKIAPEGTIFTVFNKFVEIKHPKLRTNIHYLYIGSYFCRKEGSPDTNPCECGIFEKCYKHVKDLDNGVGLYLPANITYEAIRVADCDIKTITAFVGDGKARQTAFGDVKIKTLESGDGWHDVEKTDYLLKGVKGECWPVYGEEFWKIYKAG